MRHAAKSVNSILDLRNDLIYRCCDWRILPGSRFHGKTVVARRLQKELFFIRLLAWIIQYTHMCIILLFIHRRWWRLCLWLEIKMRDHEGDSCWMLWQTQEPACVCVCISSNYLCKKNKITRAWKYVPAASRRLYLIVPLWVVTQKSGFIFWLKCRCAAVAARRPIFMIAAQNTREGIDRFSLFDTYAGVAVSPSFDKVSTFDVTVSFNKKKKIVQIIAFQ